MPQVAARRRLIKKNIRVHPCQPVAAKLKAKTDPLAQLNLFCMFNRGVPIIKIGSDLFLL